jgi:hypothetical protein
MALSPFCDHGLSTAGAVARAADAIRHRELDSLRRAELLATLGIFGKLADKGLDVLSIIRREEMHDSPIAQMFVLEGEQIRGRKSVLQVLQLRFGDEAAKEFEEAVNRHEDLERLQELLQLAVTVRRLSQFRKALTAG